MDADDVERLSREQLVAGCHLKLAKVGGLRAALDAAQTANRHGLPVTVTNALGTSLDAAANLHLAAVIPSLSSACEVGANYLSEDPARPKLERKPTMAVPEGPGIGLELPDELFG